MAAESTIRATNPAQLQSPFDGTSAEYRAWKKRRLQLQDQLQTGSVEPFVISPSLTQTSDHTALKALCSRVHDYGHAIYQWTEIPDNVSAAVQKLNASLSLTEHDRGVVHGTGGLSLLQDLGGTARGRFIPYTSRAMGWHTDGYYNDPEQTLRSFSLHCIHPAATGGALSLLDYELILISLYDEDPDLIKLLCDKQSMMLPANKDSLGHNRPDRHAPVFFNHADGKLGVRFTTRTRNINWHTPDTQAAAERMAELIAGNSQWQQTVKLAAGQGIVTRNVLHSRQSFVDNPSDPGRQMLRGRYVQEPVYNPNYSCG